ncbi:MAG: hypothetical protein QOI24_422 [Acidobacteriota bacterium]|jgi:hypothetical protein|nr:hypothetical protein [Acidobacteriota bacterium]
MPRSASDDLAESVLRALLWLAAFFFACGIFLAATLLLRDLPPTAPVAIGRVTVEKASKLRDYATAALFFLIVPFATIRLQRLGAKENARVRRLFAWRNDSDGLEKLASLLFIAPFFLAPFLYLTTFKWGWPLLIPLLLSQLAPRALALVHGTRWLRTLLAREMWPHHALIVFEAASWILFRYIAVGKRIAHIPTLFLEVVFIAFFLLIFWCAYLLIARIASFTLDLSVDIALQRVAIAALPLVALPAMALLFIPGSTAISIVMLGVVITMPLALRGRTPIDGRTVRNVVAYAIVPYLFYCVSYASTAALAQWIDLFHRGEALGPASDYLRGKVPYRDVFVLHGLMEDGMLDAWLMQLFGRNVEIALARPVVLGSFAAPVLWFVGMALFDSIPLALLTVFLGAVTTIDNERAFFELLVVALLLGAMRRNSRVLLALSGLFAGVALFFSLDIGLYSIVAGVVTLLLWRRSSVISFVAGVAIGIAPFVIYLASRGAFGAFLDTSFVAIPRIIDAAWSLPFPDLTTTFRKDLNLHTISDFFLFEKFRFILNPLVIGLAILVLAQRAITRKTTDFDLGLGALTIFAAITQRSALGRADFPHQYFSAFLIGPMLVALLVLLVRAASRTWSARDRSAQAFLLLAAIAILPFIAIALWVPDIANARIDDTVHYLGRVSRIGYIEPAAEDIRHRIEQVRYHVFELSPKGSPIFDFSNQPAFYFFCDRPNPTRFYQVPILSPREYQRETIVALERAKPSLVIRRSPQEFDVFDGIENATRAQAVAAYIDDRYAYARSTRGVEIWKRKPGASAPISVDSYLRRIKLPTLKELNAIGSRSRVVFPIIGSVHGANDTYWISDLILHNPFADAMPIGLRYVAGDVRIDRHVTLAARQTMRWEDVVKTLFQAPDSRGTLWIDYRGEKSPVARVKTYDAAHENARGVLESPLTERDTASAYKGAPDLTIVGIPGGATRRVNVGFVNVGKIGATVRVTAQTRGGKQIGRPYQEGVAEDESLLLTDVEKLLGVTIDESVTVHVTMIAGEGVAFATVIDFSGDSQLIAAVPATQQ